MKEELELREDPLTRVKVRNFLTKELIEIVSLN